MGDRPVKRLKVIPTDSHHQEPPGPAFDCSDNPANPGSIGSDRSLSSLHRTITPPPRPRSRLPSQTQHESVADASIHKSDDGNRPKLIPSPIQLTNIRDLPASSGNNVDTVRLRDILGDPMVRECWQFNFLHDVDFIMSQLDEDVRALVQVKIVHGSWKREAPNRIRIDEQCSRYPNVEAITAYMPEPFGTHHSKMMVLLRHDDLAQVIIHTANMIPGDWANMCQAVWRSPLLPLSNTGESKEPASSTIGSGARFKRDLLAYLEAYGSKKTGQLVKQLEKHDFSAVRAALIASVPSKQKVNEMNSRKAPLWGWPALKDTLRNVPVLHEKNTSGSPKKPHIVIQVSSIASLGQTDKWLKEIFFESLSPSSVLSSATPRPKYSVIFPTPDEIRRSLNGYGSGGSIHMKLQSPAQQRQLQYMRPYLCHWAGDREDPISDSGGANAVKREAGRRRAAPHIKTYVRFSDAEYMDRIDWAMVTSANLSTQAWGAAPNANGEVRICSWEIGVIVWPELFVGSENNGKAEMVPCFKRDTPSSELIEVLEGQDSTAPSAIVGFRMPYDLPLVPYSATDIPWCATSSHSEPDWLGQTWEG
ncbi:hypothetical protein Plec18167_001196 [Paecilomyces lecythidis]|uniref:Tyrosyl-DNA phosphodiesterase n=1 Tax=Paecilomyces lecythidis TaxID=3004212 RepID=A0ABR3YCM4_9EURO